MDQEISTIRLDERLKNIYEAHEDLKKAIYSLSSNLSELITKVSIVERLGKELEIMRTDLNTLSTKTIYLDSQLSSPIKDMSLELKVIRDRILILEQKQVHNSTTWTNIFNIIGQIIVIVVGGIIIYKMGIHQ